jgi:hypothetical protein
MKAAPAQAGCNAAELSLTKSEAAFIMGMVESPLSDLQTALVQLLEGGSCDFTADVTAANFSCRQPKAVICAKHSRRDARNRSGSGPYDARDGSPLLPEIGTTSAKRPNMETPFTV